MKQQRLFLISTGLFSIIAILFLYLLVGGKDGSVVAESSREQHFVTFERIHNLLIANYIHPLQSKDLIAGAVDGIKFVVNKKVKQADFSRLTEADTLGKFRWYYLGVSSRFQNKVKEEEFFRGALYGMFKVLNDPYTTYLNQREYKRLTEMMQGGNFSGVGIYIELDKQNNNRLMVVKPIEGTPGYRAGLMAGDYIVMIDRQYTEGIDIQRAQDLIRGKAGTQVTLMIERKVNGNGDGDKGGQNGKNNGNNSKFIRKEFTIKRENIHVNSVTAKVINKNIGYIELSNFGEFTTDELEKELLKFEQNNVKGLILDLRNNGGGYITAALDVCSKFLPQGSAVVSVVDKNARSKSYSSKGNRHPKLPLVVIINRFSASASEITAGALQDHGRAKLIGEKSFGKASVQTILPMDIESGGGALKVTTAKYLTPNGRDIMKKGILPDIQVSLERRPKSEADDPQIQKALELLNSSL